MTSEIPFELTVNDLKELRDDGSPHTVLDVREAQEVMVCSLDPSLHIPMSEIPASLDRLPDIHPIIVLCHHGMRSAQVVAWLRHNGIGSAINLKGGIDRWAKEIDASMATY